MTTSLLTKLGFNAASTFLCACSAHGTTHVFDLRAAALAASRMRRTADGIKYLNRRDEALPPVEVGVMARIRAPHGSGAEAAAHDFVVERLAAAAHFAGDFLYNITLPGFLSAHSLSSCAAQPAAALAAAAAVADARSRPLGTCVELAGGARCPLALVGKVVAVCRTRGAPELGGAAGSGRRTAAAAAAGVAVRRIAMRSSEDFAETMPVWADAQALQPLINHSTTCFTTATFTTYEAQQQHTVTTQHNHAPLTAVLERKQHTCHSAAAEQLRCSQQSACALDAATGACMKVDTAKRRAAHRTGHSMLYAGLVCCMA